MLQEDRQAQDKLERAWEGPLLKKGIGKPKDMDARIGNASREKELCDKSGEVLRKSPTPTYPFSQKSSLGSIDP